MRKKYRAVIYCRAASQDDSGNTLEKQSARLRGLAKLSSRECMSSQTEENAKVNNED